MSSRSAANTDQAVRDKENTKHRITDFISRALKDQSKHQTPNTKHPRTTDFISRAITKRVVTKFCQRESHSVCSLMCMSSEWSTIEQRKKNVIGAATNSG